MEPHQRSAVPCVIAPVANSMLRQAIARFYGIVACSASRKSGCELDQRVRSLAPPLEAGMLPNAGAGKRNAS